MRIRHEARRRHYRRCQTSYGLVKQTVTSRKQVPFLGASRILTSPSSNDAHLDRGSAGARSGTKREAAVKQKMGNCPRMLRNCLLYTSDAADDTPCVDL
eukprot:7003384-Pyramimonas_sp.AAC.1